MLFRCCCWLVFKTLVLWTKSKSSFFYGKVLYRLNYLTSPTFLSLNSDFFSFLNLNFDSWVLTGLVIFSKCLFLFYRTGHMLWKPFPCQQGHNPASTTKLRAEVCCCKMWWHGPWFVLSCFQQNTCSSDQLKKWIHFHCLTNSLNQFGSKYLIVSSGCVLLSFSHSLQFINNYSLKSHLFHFLLVILEFTFFFPFPLCWALHVVADSLSNRVRVWWCKFSLYPFQIIWLGASKSSHSIRWLIFPSFPLW